MSNGTTGHAGFDMGSVLDFLQEIGGYGTEIMDNAAEIEKMLQEGFEWILEGTILSEMKTSIPPMLQDALAQLDSIDLEFLTRMAADMKDKVEVALGDVPFPSLDADFGILLDKLKEIFPDDLQGVDLSALKQKLDPIINTLSSSEISFRIIKDNPAVMAERGNPSGSANQTGEPVLQDRVQSKQQSTTLEGELDKKIKAFFLSNSTITGSLDALNIKIEKAIADSGIITELDDQLLVLKSTLIHTKPLTLELIIAEVGNLAKALGPSALSIVEEIVAEIVDTIQTIFPEIKNIGQELSEQISSLISILNLGEVPTQGLFTLPAFLLAIPATLASEITGKPIPQFPGLQQDYDFFTDKSLYGLNQIGDGIFSPILDELDQELLGRLWSVSTGILSQIWSFPDKFHPVYADKRESGKLDFSTSIWLYQCLFSFLWPIFKLVLTYTRRPDHWKYKEAKYDFILGLIHFVLFSIQLTLEETEVVDKSDDRLQWSSMIDPMPGLISSAIALITEPNDDPNIHFDAIHSAVTTIRGMGLNQELAAQRGKLLINLTDRNQDGAIRKAFREVHDILEVVNPLPPRSILALFDKAAIPLDTATGTLKNAIDAVKGQWTIDDIGNNQLDFDNINSNLYTIKTKVDDCLDELSLIEDTDLTELNTALLQKIGAPPPDTEEEPGRSIRANMTAFEAALAVVKAGAGLPLGNNNNQINLPAAKTQLDVAAKSLDPALELIETQTITSALRDARIALDNFHQTLYTQKIPAARAFLNTKLNANRTASAQDPAMNDLTGTLDTTNLTAGSIGACLQDIQTSLSDIEIGVDIVRNSTDPRAINTGIGDLYTFLTQTKTKWQALGPLLDPVMTNLRVLQGHAQTVAKTLEITTPVNNYHSLLQALDPGHNDYQIGQIIAALDSDLTTAITSALQGLDQFKSNVLDRVELLVTKLETAQAELDSLRTQFRNYFGIIEATDDKIMEIEGVINQAIVSLDKDNLLNQVNLANIALENIKGTVNYSDPDPIPAFLQTINNGKSRLAPETADSVGAILENARDAFNFDEVTRNKLTQPKTLVDSMMHDMNIIKENIRFLPDTLPNNTIEKKTSIIDKSLANLKKIGQPKANKADLEESRSLKALSLGIPFLLKMSYGGLYLWYVSDQPLEITSITPDPGNPLILTAQIEDPDLGIVLGLDHDIIWQRQMQDGSWEEITNLNNNKETIVLSSWEYLRHTIRAKLIYENGYTTKEYTYEGAPVANAGPDQTLFDTDVFIMAAIPSVGTGSWTAADPNVTIADPNSPTTIVSGLPSGERATLTWTETHYSQSQSATITIYNAKANAGPDQVLCENDTFIMAAIPSAGTGEWTTNNPNIAITDPNSSATTVSDLAPGESATLTWTETLGAQSDFATLIIHNAIRPVADAGPDQILCETDTFIMAAVRSAGAGVWTTDNPDVTIVDPNSPTAIIQNLAPGAIATLTWTETNGNCSDSDNVTIRNARRPVADAGPDQILCETETFIMAAIPSAGTGLWTTSNPDVTITDPTSPTSTVTGLPAGTSAVLTWTETNGNCSDSAEVTIQNNIQPDANAGPDQALSNTGNFTMVAVPSAGTGLWTTSNPDVTITDPASPTTTVTGLPAGTSAVLTWTETNGNCSDSAEVTIQNIIVQ